MAEVEQRQLAEGFSLAAVHPGDFLDLEVTVRPAKDVAEEARRADRAAAQGDLFSLSDKRPLEPIPFNFHYIVRYPDEREPRRLKVIDWEINEAWRSWRHAYPDTIDRIRDKWLNELCGPSRSPLFSWGTCTDSSNNSWCSACIGHLVWRDGQSSSIRRLGSSSTACSAMQERWQLACSRSKHNSATLRAEAKSTTALYAALDPLFRCAT